MKYSSLVIIFLLFEWACLAQHSPDNTKDKPPLDTTVFRTWASVGGGVISNDGQYVSYISNNFPVPGHTLVIAAVKGKWQRMIRSFSNARFTTDSKEILFLTGKDSLCIQTLGTDSVTYITGVAVYWMQETFGKGEWIAYGTNGSSPLIRMKNLLTGEEKEFPGAIACQFSKGGDRLVLEYTDSAVREYALDENLLGTIWLPRGKGKAGRFAFDRGGHRVAFLVSRDNGDAAEEEVWYSSSIMDTAICLLHGRMEGLAQDLLVADQTPEFSITGAYIFFGVRKSNGKDITVRDNSAGVDIWSYEDPELRPFQVADAKIPRVYTAAIKIGDGTVQRIEGEDEYIVFKSAQYILLKHGLGNYSMFEASWNEAARVTFSLLQLQDGSRTILRKNIINEQGDLAMSPTGRWIVYYDFAANDYFSYDTQSGITKNITKSKSRIWINNEHKYLQRTLCWVPWMQTWFDHDSVVLIYDNYDIWSVDPSGVKTPFCLTNGFGARNHVKFEALALENRGEPEPPVILNGSRLVLKAIDLRNQNRGFYEAVMGSSTDPTRCIMGPYVYGAWSGDGNYNYGPLRATGSGRYLVYRMSATESPNYFVTDDFIHFEAVSDIQPQRKYNWLSTELLHWKTFDGSYSAGVLYKPENFDPTKQYPILFDYYEIRSDELNLYRAPVPSGDRINIPWYVSQGYLVFTPDIHYKIGEPGRSAYNCVVSAAAMLSKMPWVDKTRMGIQGHSFGGYETNYLVTHTGIFAAACSAAGFSDLISLQGSDTRNGYFAYHLERFQGQIGASFSARPDLYIKNSPILNASHVTTPLLMMHNNDDNVVPFSQSVEFFTGLRRLGKKVWLLQYDRSRHSVYGYRATMDYTIRMNQFFDHYLKGRPEPNWMTGSASPELRAIYTGLGFGPK